MIDASKHASLFDADKMPKAGVLVVGLGSIGSRLALHLAELDVLSAVMDDDRVEGHNIANQAYTKHDYANDSYKVDAMHAMVYQKGGGSIETIQGRAKNGIKLLYGTVACCIDSMDGDSGRIRLFDGVSGNGVTKLFIDCRMTATSVMVYVLDPSEDTQAQRYRETLYPDSDVVEETGGCGLTQSLGATAQLAASLATVRIIDWIMGGKRVFETLMDWKTGLYMEQPL